MRLSGLSLAAILLISSVALAQHSSGGGGSSGGGASSGGGSHGGSSGGSSSSGGSHSAGGSAAHTSGTHTANSGASASGHRSQGNALQSGARGSAHMKAQPEKRGFFSVVLHPFRKPQPKPVADLRRWPCVKGPCPVCPAGSAHSGGCGIPAYNNVCTRHELWSGGSCLSQSQFLDNCAGQRLAMDQQARHMHTAEAERDRACASGSAQECSDLSGNVQSESLLYQTLLERYRQCRTRWPSSAFGASATFGSFQWWQFDRLGTEN
jgi:hypothetical protein